MAPSGPPIDSGPVRDIRCFPSGDAHFRRAAAAAFDGIAETVPADRVEEVLRAALRPGYPRVEVRRQSELARAFDQDRWYVYRDG